MADYSDPISNQILASLSKREPELPNPRFEPVSVKMWDFLYQAGNRISDVYFPLDTLVFISAILEKGTSVETYMIGSEEMRGIDVVLGGQVSTNLGVVETVGRCLKMRAQTLQTEFERSAELRERVLSYHSLNLC